MSLGQPIPIASTDADLALAMMRTAIARLRYAAAEIEELAAFLRAGRITPAGAVAMLRERDLADIVLEQRAEAA